MPVFVGQNQKGTPRSWERSRHLPFPVSFRVSHEQLQFHGDGDWPATTGQEQCTGYRSTGTRQGTRMALPHGCCADGDSARGWVHGTGIQEGMVFPPPLCAPGQLRQCVLSQHLQESGAISSCLVSVPMHGPRHGQCLLTPPPVPQVGASYLFLGHRIVASGQLPVALPARFPFSSLPPTRVFPLLGRAACCPRTALTTATYRLPT